MQAATGSGEQPDGKASSRRTQQAAERAGRQQEPEPLGRGWGGTQNNTIVNCFIAENLGDKAKPPDQCNVIAP